MKTRNINSLSDELLAAYLDGNTTAEETRQVLQALNGDKEIQETLITAERVDSFLNKDIQEYKILPMAQMAARGDGNLCDFQCEEYILNKHHIPFDDSVLSKEAKNNRWLKDKGTPLHSVGRLLEQKGLSVIRRYNSTLKDLEQVLDESCDVITIINNNPHHAVIALEYCRNEESIVIFDPSDKHKARLPINQFEEAWKSSSCYMVYVNAKNRDYNPSPIDLKDIELTEDLLELREAIAENAHDVWAAARIKEGWTYGVVRNDAKKQHPDLIPYAELTDGEKEYDRIMALNTIRLVKKLGYDMVKHKNTELYKLLIGRLHQQEEVYYCAECGTPIFKGQIYCDTCGKKLDYTVFIGHNR